MKQTAQEYQNEFFKNEGYVFFDSIEEAAKEYCKNRNVSMETAIEGIENDTNADCVILNDGSVAVYPKSGMLVKVEKTEELYKKMQNGEITKLKYYLYEKNMTVAKLSEIAGINKRTLDEYVSGRRDIKTIALVKGLRIAEALECSVYDLL